MLHHPQVRRGQRPERREFYTPPQVGTIMSRVLQPEPGMEIDDPTCGSVGLLVKCEIEKHRGFSNLRTSSETTGRNTSTRPGPWPT